MKTKPIIFLLALTFLFLFSGISQAGMFSPNDYNECIFKNMKHAKNRLSALTTYMACKKKFPDEPNKGPSGMFGPQDYSECVLKHNKGVENQYASLVIQQACLKKFKETAPVEAKETAPRTPLKFDFSDIR
jgi:hypothetical protein